ncbi:MAG TPA: tetratricopeptide repeat protein [Aquaticitalea sp.]|nr:tetratricopeptide repeat protein [Aquaticitalea sp.]
MKQLVFFLLFPFVIFAQSSFEDVERMLADKQFKQAESEMKIFVSQHPSDLNGIELLADVYGQQKKWDNAIEQYKKLVDFSPNTANYHYKYGGAMGMKALEVNKLKALGMIGDVKAAFLKAAELDPNHIDTRWALVKLYMQLPGMIGGSKNKALRYADELEKLSKVDGYLAKGYLHAYDDDYELAETYYKKALTIGRSKICYRELAQFYVDNKHYKKAILYLNEGYEKHGTDEFLQQIEALQKQN